MAFRNHSLSPVYLIYLELPTSCKSSIVNKIEHIALYADQPKNWLLKNAANRKIKIQVKAVNHQVQYIPSHRKCCSEKSIEDIIECDYFE